MWIQKDIVLHAKPRGFHLITDDVLQDLPEISNFRIGLLHLFIQHSSASLSINENADPTVRLDLESYFNSSVPENAAYFQHTFEGSDDMPAHIKSVIIGSSQSVPIRDGSLQLGTWQGIYLCEHRNHGGKRHVVATISGESD